MSNSLILPHSANRAKIGAASEARMPPLLTKHCSPLARQAMLEGKFKIGTLREFRSAEIDSGAFSDLGEGRITTSIVGDVHNFSGMIDTHRFEGVSMMGHKSAIHIEDEIDANVFCASIGPYNRARHERLMEVSQHYKGNPEWTAYLILDTAKMLQALYDLVVSIPGRFEVSAGKVGYSERHREGPQAEIRALLGNSNRARRQMESIFQKPPRFEIEEEFRFVVHLWDKTAYETIWTRDAPSLMEAFRRAIHHEGSATL